VAVVTVNDATSNAIGVLSLSLSPFLPVLVIAASFRSSAVSRPRTRFIESTIVWGLYRVSAACTPQLPSGIRGRLRHGGKLEAGVSLKHNPNAIRTPMNVRETERERERERESS